MSATSKFSNVPVESDTRIVAQSEIRVGDYDALHQRWIWEGIRAESVIFLSKDVQTLDDARLEALVRELPLVRKHTQFTIKRGGAGYTFVNFNFES